MNDENAPHRFPQDAAGRFDGGRSHEDLPHDGTIPQSAADGGPPTGTPAGPDAAQPAAFPVQDAPTDRLEPMGAPAGTGWSADPPPSTFSAPAWNGAPTAYPTAHPAGPGGPSGVGSPSPFGPDLATASATPAGPAVPAPQRRGPGWGGVGALVVLGMVLSSGATFGGVMAYDHFLEPDPVAASQPASDGGTDARPASVSTGETPDWSAVAGKVSSSAVAIQVSTSGGTSQGTGVVLDEEGSVLTNNHVVDGAQAVQVTTTEGASYSATVVGTDPTTDLAVIRLDSPPDGLVPAVFADSSSVEVGQPVMALGTPLGLENTVTTGIISAVDRPVTAGGEQGEQGGQSEATYTSALQTDAAINPGNSGGPLVDAAGQVIGINTAIAGIPGASGQAGSIGLGFAIPSDTAMMIARQLQEDGTADHAFLGVTTTDGTTSSGDATHSGAEVVSIEPGGPAAGTSLREGDLITGVDDIPVGGAAALTGVVRGMEVDSTHHLEVVRDGTTQTVEVTLAQRPS